MKRYVMLLAWVAGSAMGQSGHTVATQQASYVVTLNFNSAVLNTAEARRQLGDLEAKLAPRETQLRQLNESFEAEKKKFDTDSQVLSDDAKRTRIQELNKKSQELQRETEDFQNDSRAAAEQIYQHVAEKLFGMLDDYSKQHGYSLVVERGNDSAPVVWYAAASFDITEQVVKAYDLKFSTSSPASSGTPAAPSPANAPSAPSPRSPQEQAASGPGKVQNGPP